MTNHLISVALCALGAEKVVSNELRKLHFTILDTARGRVRFSSDTAGLYRALMSLRAADRLLLECGRFPAGDFDKLFTGTSAVPWETLVPPGMGLKVAKVRSGRSLLAAETSIQAVVHKAAAARLCKAHKVERLPSDTGDGKTPIAELRVYIDKDTVQILLDLSGEPLFKRGYRTEGGLAPLRETTAASLLFLSGWKRKFPLYDPFCGSGTIAIEASLYAWDMAPNLGRSFALSSLVPGDRKLEEAIRGELLGRINTERVIRIEGSDSSRRSVALAESNARRAYDIARGKAPGQGIQTGEKLPFMPGFKPLPMTASRARTEPGFIITNPPYGKRLGERAESEALYRDMGMLSTRFPGWKLAVISDHPGFESFFGREADTIKKITNGAIDSFLYEFTSL
ncbi:MAG: class I SAM-dependent RNA methyltransferase [Spirochaetaceae bacterium]|nr:class I SAM-dependent RNA methyltransferase [Spirochaetaceae bacterium]